MNKSPLRPHLHDRPPLTAPRVLLVTFRWVLVAAWTTVVLTTQGESGTLAAIQRIAACLPLSFLLANALWQHIPLKYACLVAFACATLVGVLNLLFFQAGAVAMDNLSTLAASACGAAAGSVVAYPLSSLFKDSETNVTAAPNSPARPIPAKNRRASYCQISVTNAFRTLAVEYIKIDEYKTT